MQPTGLECLVQPNGAPRTSNDEHRSTGSRSAWSSWAAIAFGFGALRWVTPYLVFCFMQLHEYSALESIAWAAGITMMMFPVLFLFAVATKWLMLGRIRPG